MVEESVLMTPGVPLVPGYTESVPIPASGPPAPVHTEPGLLIGDIPVGAAVPGIGVSPLGVPEVDMAMWGSPYEMPGVVPSTSILSPLEGPAMPVPISGPPMPVSSEPGLLSADIPAGAEVPQTGMVGPAGTSMVGEPMPVSTPAIPVSSEPVLDVVEPVGQGMPAVESSIPSAIPGLDIPMTSSLMDVSGCDINTCAHFMEEALSVGLASQMPAPIDVGAGATAVESPPVPYAAPPAPVTTEPGLMVADVPPTEEVAYSASPMIGAAIPVPDVPGAVSVGDQAGAMAGPAAMTVSGQPEAAVSEAMGAVQPEAAGELISLSADPQATVGMAETTAGLAEAVMPVMAGETAGVTGVPEIAAVSAVPGMDIPMSASLFDIPGCDINSCAQMAESMMQMVGPMMQMAEPMMQMATSMFGSIGGGAVPGMDMPATGSLFDLPGCDINSCAQMAEAVMQMAEPVMQMAEAMVEMA